MRRLLLSVLLLIGPTQASGEAAQRGGFVWQDETEDFGGLSGLVMEDGGRSLLAVSDRGMLFRATVLRDAEGRISDVRRVWAGRLLDNKGAPVSGFTADAEALALAPDGKILVAFESYTRVAAFALPDLHPEPLSRWDRFHDYWDNRAFESLAVLPDGRLLALLEGAGEGVYRSFVSDGGDWRPGPTLPADGSYSATDASFGPDGRFYLLERDVTITGSFSTRVRRFDYADGVFTTAGTVLETGAGELGNMEGMSLWRDGRGRMILSLVSDNNFSRWRETAIAEFEIDE